jgi:hypothetical protein
MQRIASEKSPARLNPSESSIGMFMIIMLLVPKGTACGKGRFKIMTNTKIPIAIYNLLKLRTII